MRESLAIFALAAALAGCAAPPGPAAVAVPPGRYAAAFDAARDLLVGYRYNLERIDAREGIITTEPKPTAGFATPWDLEQSSSRQEFEDFLNDHRRIVRIIFEPAPGIAAPPALDLREFDRPMTAHVEVIVERLHRPGWHPEPSAVRFSTFATDPALQPRGMWPQYSVAFTQDPLLARRIAGHLRSRLSADAASRPPAPASR